MPTARQKTLEECGTPQEALQELLSPFVVGGGSAIAPECQEVAAAQVPEPFHWLLVHRNHMTKVLEAQYGRPMDLEVLEHHLEDDFYTRKILLRPQGTDQVVEVGIVRLNFRFMSREVREEILARHTPLGAILIRHKVLRKVQPRWYLKFPPSAPLLEAAGVAFPNASYGRIGTIYCNGEPAIEVLEVVSGLEKTFDERVL